MDNVKKIKKITTDRDTFYILVSFLESLHCYRVMQKVEKLSDGRIKLGLGTLYMVLKNHLEVKMA